MTTLNNDAAGTGIISHSPEGALEQGFQITILLFQQNKESFPNPAAPPTALRSASAMLQDLLIALEMSEVSSSDERIVTRALDIEATVRLVRHIETLLVGFLSRTSEGSVCAGICVATAGSTAEPSSRSVAGLLRGKMPPELVLFSPDAYEQARGLPGLTFKRAAPQAGLSECWELCPPKWLPASPPPFAVRQAVPERRKPGLLTPLENASARFASARRWAKMLRTGTSFRTKAILSAVALFGIAGAGGMALRGRGRRVTAGVPTSKAPSATQVYQVPGPVPATVSPKSSETVPTREPVLKTTLPQPAPKRPAPQTSAEEHGTALSHLAGGMSEEDIRRTLGKADAAAGNGQYGQAIAYYNYILKRYPNYAPAAKGKYRAEHP